MPFDLKQLRWAIAAYDHGSFRKAAIALGVQESTISRRIRDLEDKMGASLFIRRPSGVLPTLAGERFIGHVREVVSACHSAMMVTPSPNSTRQSGAAFPSSSTVTRPFRKAWL